MDEKEAETQNNTLTIEIPSETKDDIFDNIKEPRKEIEKHRRSIDRIFVSQYMDDTSTYNEVYGSDDYVVTYSKEDKSFLGWSVNTKNNGPQQPDVYFKADQIEDLNLRLGTLLSKKILSLYGYNKHWLIDLNSDRTNNERFLKLKQPVDCEKNIYQFFSNDAIGFLPNDLIQVSVRNRKIYKYCLKDRPINTVLWEYSQINDIEIPESLYGQVKNLRCTICRTKLFLIVKGCKTTILQFDLLKMNLERQYIANANSLSSMVVMNTNQTLLAYYCFIFSMKNGMLISYENYGEEPVEFITLKNNSERLVMNCYSNVHKLIDPYQAYDEIDISNDFNKTSVITKLNRKIFIDNGNVCVRNGSDENKLQQLSNEVIYRNSIYTSSVFNIIQSMFKEIIDRADIKKVASPDDKIKLKNRDLYEYILRPNDIYDEISFEHNDIISCCIPFPHILSYKLLNNQDLIIISMEAIEIFALLDKGFKNRYFWKNNDWNDIYKKFEKDRNSIYDINFVNEHYKPLIGRILKYEFNDSKDSIPLPNFMGQNTNHRKTIAEDVISDNLVSSKFGIEMLKIAIKENCDSVVRPIINNTIESIQNYSVNSMTFISLNLPKLCDDYPDYIIKYISYTSIILSPFCNNIRNSKNTSIHSYTNIYIKESHMDKNVFKAISSIYKWLIQHLRIKEEIQTVSFIVPFSQICVYQDDSKNNDHENENNDPENCDFNNNDYESHASKNNDHENHETENDDYENHASKNNDHENRETGKNHDIKSKIILGYAQAFFIVLKSNITNDGSDNLFNWFPTSLLAVYKLITGDSGSLSSFTYPIGDYNKKEEYLLQKAKIIMEIELFYMLPWQRNNKKWFPNWIYYDLPVTEARKLINAIDNEQTVFNYPPLISEELRNLVVLADDNNKLENKIDQTKEELKQQMEFIMKNIGVEKDNEEEQDSEEEEQENKLEKQMEQTKEELPKQHVGLKQQMDKHALQMDKLALQMDKLNQQMENIMELLLKRN
ncbi:unnamed protein product [Rhizophagus irregularis]|nr:unnamed protein product [Rhizophagus irregularis]CAB5181684.1 unnamed protein product [Rhizophagus irregularis]